MIRILSTLILTLYTSICFSQNIKTIDTINLDEVAVKILREPNKKNLSVFSINSISTEEIQRYASQINLSEYLNLIPSVFIMNNNNFAQDERISIRGFGSRANFGVRGIKIFVDDIPETFVDGQSQIDNINFEIIDNIEVLRGVNSSLYGSSSGGVISIRTIEDFNDKLVKANLSLGSFNASKFYFTYGVNKNDNKLILHLNQTKSDGYRYNTDFKNDFIFMKNNIKSKNGSIDIISGFTEKKFGANGFYASPEAIDQYEETQSSFFAVSTKFKKEKLVLKPKLYWRRNQDEYVYIRNNPEIYRNLHISNKIYFDLNFIKFYDSGSFSNFGIDNSQSYISSNNLGSHKRFTSTVYFDHTFHLVDDKLIVSPGFSVSYFSDLSFHFFPGIDLGYHLSEKSKLYANFGKTYRIPTYTDLYYSDRNTIGNPDLDPEHAVSNELGFKFENENIQLSSSFFQRKSTNIIDYVKENETEKWRATNIRNLDTKGFDVDLRYVKVLRIGYTYLFDDSYVNDINFSRYSINSLKHQLTSSISLNYSKRLSQNLMLKYGERSDKSNHSVVDTNIKYSLGSKGYLFFSLNNIFDESYSETNLVPMPGRNFLFGFINYFE